MYYSEFYDKKLKLFSVPVYSFESFNDVLKENSFILLGVKRVFKVFGKDCFELKLKYNDICFSAFVRWVYGK